MGSSGGSENCDPWDLECHAKKAANAMTNISTFGLVGLEDGQIKKGATVNAIDETVGELSGRNMQRKALMDSKDALDEEKIRKAEQLKAEQNRKFQQDVNASNAAGATYNSEAAKSRSSMGTSKLEKDFLGL